MAGSLLKRPLPVAWLPPRDPLRPQFPSDAPLVVWAPGDAAPRLVGLDTLPPGKAVAVVYDARDVLLLSVAVPPLSGARLRQALPNLIEDRVLQDPAACRIAVGPRRPDGQRTLAVLDRAWHDAVVEAFRQRGRQVAAAWPAALVMPWREGSWSLACVGPSMALRTGPTDGIGWPGGGEAQAQRDAARALIDNALAGGATAAADGTIDLYATDAGTLPALVEAAHGAGLRAFPHPMPMPAGAPVDLVTDVPEGDAGGLAVRVVADAWKWPLRLLVAAGVAWVLGLNLHWAMLATESSSLAGGIQSRLREIVPGGPVVDPVAQASRRIGQLRARAGEHGPDDVLPMLARLSAALGQSADDALVGFDFRGGEMRVRFRPGVVDAPAARDALREAATRQRLDIRFEPAEPVATVRGLP